MKFSITEYDEQYTVTVYLDPEEREVYTFGFTGGACWPMEAHNNRHVSLGRVPGGFVAYTLEQWLQARTKELEALCDAYQGAEWDGSNRVGKWDPKADTLIEGLNRDLEEAVCHLTGGIFTYQDAEDYYRHTSEDEKRELLARPRQEAVAELVEDANQQGGAYLRDSDCDALLDQWQAEFQESK
jgi:hypothetical protein